MKAGHKVSPKLAEKWQKALNPHLLPGEELLVVSRANNLRPMTDGVAISNFRLAGFTSLSGWSASYPFDVPTVIEFSGKKDTVTVEIDPEAPNYESDAAMYREQMVFKMVPSQDHDLLRSVLEAARAAFDTETYQLALARRAEEVLSSRPTGKSQDLEAKQEELRARLEAARRGDAGVRVPSEAERLRQQKHEARQQQLQERREELEAKLATGKQAIADEKADRLAEGDVSEGTSMTIYRDGTFATRGFGGFGKQSARDKLVGFEHDDDSMRRKSVAGRGAAALVTSGFSLAASNNRGVLYVTVTGQATGVRTFTTRNPSNGVLKSVRTLKGAADHVISRADTAGATEARQPESAVSAIFNQIRQLAELHDAGILSDAEYAAKKQELLDRM